MSPATTTLSRRSSAQQDSAWLSKTMSYYAAFLALGLVAASLGPTLPALAEHTQTRLSEISLIFTAYGLGYLLASFLGGRLYDWLPGHPVMAAVLVVMGVMLVLLPLMALLWLLAAVGLLLGMAAGMLDVGGNTLLVWVHREKVGPFMNGLHFFFAAGGFLSPIIVAQAVLLTGDVTWAYWALAILMLPLAVWLLRLRSPAAQGISKDGPAGQANRASLGLIVFFFFLHVGAEVSFAGWIFTYAVAAGLGPETTAAYLTSAFWGSLTLGRLLAIPIAARSSYLSMLFGDLAGCLASVGIVLLWPSSLTALWLGTLGMGLSIASVFPTSVSLAERRMRITGQITGWFFLGASAGSMSLPWLIGQLFESIGPRVTMLAIMVDLIAALAIFGVLAASSVRPAASGG